VTLLGDACHPVTPYMASGAAMALEGRRGAGALQRRSRRSRRRSGLRGDAQGQASAVQTGSSANTWMRNATNPDWLYDMWNVPLVTRVDA
jgi:salicylate hydroxylase/6-hydroxynicotinate 3-monooxygenase